jgi:tetratricopeptide (TPR) repeat protein
MLGNLGRVLLARGDPAGSENALRRSIALANASGAGSFTLSESLSALAQAVAVQGRTAEAVRFAESALDHALPDDADAAVAWRTLGKLLATTVSPKGTWIELAPLVRDGQTLDAEECFARALRIFVAVELRSEQAATYDAWAAFEEQRGHADRVKELRRQARELRRPARTRPL